LLDPLREAVGVGSVGEVEGDPVGIVPAATPPEKAAKALSDVPTTLRTRSTPGSSRSRASSDATRREVPARLDSEAALTVTESDSVGPAGKRLLGTLPGAVIEATSSRTAEATTAGR
jgi:hypothetical protein